MRPIAEQVILITGATDGLGKGVALELVKKGATVLVHGRDQARIDTTLAELRAVRPDAQLRSYCADFNALAGAQQLADQVLAGEQRLDVLVNNAGIGTHVPGGGERQVSADGHELRFAVNYLAPFLLTQRLVPRLLANDAAARIVNVSSIGQQPIDFDNVMLEREYSGERAYCQSKLAQIMYTIDLSQKLAHGRVTVNALHPATYMPTKIVATPVSTREEGVSATLNLIVSSEVGGKSGAYFNGLVEAQAKPQAYDAQARERLWQLSESLTSES